MEEDISPWRQTEHEENNHPHRLPPPPIPSKARTPQPTAYLQFDFDSGAGKATGAVARGRQATLDPVIVSPELFRSRSIREVALPRLPDKTDGLLERRGSFRSNHLLPLAKSLSKGETQARTGKLPGVSEASTQQLRSKLECLLKQHETHSPMRLSRNFSEVHRGKNDLIIKEKNIVFMYSPLSAGKQTQESPKKRSSGHILDKLLSDWK